MKDSAPGCIRLLIRMSYVVLRISCKVSAAGCIRFQAQKITERKGKGKEKRQRSGGSG
jgi:hypothetical protein